MIAAVPSESVIMTEEKGFRHPETARLRATSKILEISHRVTWISTERDVLRAMGPLRQDRLTRTLRHSPQHPLEAALLEAAAEVTSD